MNQEQADALTGLLIAAGHGGWTDEGAELCVAEMLTWTDEIAAQRAVGDLARTWPGQFRPTLATIIDAYHAERAVSAPDRSLEAPRGPFCEGNGWIKGEPCPRCNPYVHDIWQDMDKRGRWLRGVSLHLLHPDVTLDPRTGLKLKGELMMPIPCSRDAHQPQLFVDLDQGRQIARQAYIDDCESRGVKPNLEYFDAAIGLAEPPFQSVPDDGI